MLESQTGERCATTVEAFDCEMAVIKNGDSGKSAFAKLSFFKDFPNRCRTETLELQGEGKDDPDVRRLVTASSMDDWLWRGDHPVVKGMSWCVYSMWVYRIEIPPPKRDKDGQ